MMNRRTFIVTATGLLAVPLVGEAQQAAKIARVGYLAPNLAASVHLPEAFRQGLRTSATSRAATSSLSIEMLRGSSSDSPI